MTGSRWVWAVSVLLSCHAALAAGATPAKTLLLGRSSYTIHCANCHGIQGDGAGPSAAGLNPAPRDFRQGIFKWGSVPAGEMPSDADLLRVIRDGLNGTAMLAWKDIPEGELQAIVQHIKTFSPRWKELEPGAPIEPGPDPWGPVRMQAALERGAALYHGTARCQSCHPAYLPAEQLAAATARAGGPRPDPYFPVAKESDYGKRLFPPDFTRDRLRSVRTGTELADLYRVIAAGVGGTAMPTWKQVLPDADLWAMAYYVRELAASRKRK